MYLLHTSACVERNFSQLSLIKTKLEMNWMQKHAIL